MKNNILIFLCVLFLFGGCNKKGFEERIANYVGTWKFVGNYSTIMSKGQYSKNFYCTEASFYLKINSNNTFTTFDTLNNEIFSGKIKSNEKSPTLFRINHGFKNGKYKVIDLGINPPFCDINSNNTFLVFYVEPFDESTAAKNNLYFDGNYSTEVNYVFIKI